MASKKKKGRPVEDVPQDIADAVVEWISAGKTMRSLCAQDGMPCRQTIDKWKAKDEEFRSRIARARDDGHDCLAESLLDLAKKPVDDMVELQRRKFEADTTLKLIAKWDPRRYGDRTKVEHEGSVTFTQLVEQSYSSASENADPVDE